MTSKDITFYVDLDGKIHSDGPVEDGFILVENAKTKVSILKIDSETKEPLPGTSFKITDIDEKQNASDVPGTTWLSGETAHIIEGLETGVKYYITETGVPKGYVSDGITYFILNEDGTMDINYSDSVDDEHRDNTDITVGNTRTLVCFANRYMAVRF